MLQQLKKIIEDFLPQTYVIKQKRDERGVSGELISCLDKHSLIAEQYKVLRTNLYSISASSGKPVKSIVITSSQAKEGKSVTSSNLALTLSLDTLKKTILIDCDLRRPFIHSLFSMQRKPGFSDILLGNADIDTFIEKPFIDNLYVIPAGSLVNNPSEILSYPKIKEIIERLKAKFDFIIFDTPPVLNVTDSSILGSICDGVIMVVKAEMTQKEMIEEAFNALRHAQAKPIACVLTNFNIPISHYFTKYKYYYKYSYSNSSDKKPYNQ